ncbi:hypothetical protein B9Z55_012622 [Caenorhabditis nigoni]|uniref:Methyltransferase FkbM domain-containing protein n=1 Tax=Caenorhabditis nigoni TaxID=1611254 RepID=A0A2G5TY32_9PELO|nr:hypothetical protein B9Z55_012622 [Caenorhabditis nigoni]
MASNSGSLSMFLLLLILMITVSNYLGTNKIDLQLSETQRNLKILTNTDSNFNDYSIQSQKDLLEQVQRGINQEFYQRVMPEVVCKEKVRIGEKSDGGKYVCKPQAVNQEDCTIMSLGLNNQIEFDEHISKVTGGKCTILGADIAEQSPSTKSKYAAINGQLFVGKIPETLTLPEMLEKSGKSKVDFLKIDIEGGEHTGLEPFIKDYSVCQIFIEIHGSPSAHLEMLQKMAKYNFRIFNVNPNFKCTTCCEYSLINENCMEHYGVVPLGITIPKGNL